MSAVATSHNTLVSLAGRLTDPQDRETYASLISFIGSLPPGDELSRMAQLLGLCSLVAQRIPEAAGELLAELRDQARLAADYHAQVDARLASLPQEIAEHVDAGAIAKAMSEALRQQLAATGLRDSAVMLDSASKATKALASEVAATLKPASDGLKAVTAIIATELTKLVSASQTIQSHNRQLIERESKDSWRWLVMGALLMFVIGGLCGVLIEKNQTTDALIGLESQIQRLQTPVAAPAAGTAQKKKRVER